MREEERGEVRRREEEEGEERVRRVKERDESGGETRDPVRRFSCEFRKKVHVGLL